MWPPTYVIKLMVKAVLKLVKAMKVSLVEKLVALESNDDDEDESFYEVLNEPIHLFMFIFASCFVS
jgi:hypothetical protein